MELTSRYYRILRVFGKNLKTAREKLYPSAAKFADDLGLEHHTYRAYEAGRSQPNFETLARICEHLGVSPNDLLPAATRLARPPQAHSSDESAA